MAEAAMQSKLDKILEEFSSEAHDLYLHKEVPILESPPSALEFFRDYVSANRPVIIKNAIRHWPALDKWKLPYFREKYGDKQIKVAVTPNGYADAIEGDRFVLPEECEMPFADLITILDNPSNFPGVYYLQRQNSNLSEELPEFLEDVKELNFASEAFNQKPDAINFWLGDERAVTSMHKDPYENVYCVVAGYKDFILHPPTDLPWVPYRSYPQAAYKRQEKQGKWDIVPQTEMEPVPWICIDPLKPDLEQYPDYAKAKAIHCRVEAGDAFYLPSLWFHHVRQSHACIAVNFWYDMEYDIRYNYFELLRKIVSLKERNS